MEAVEEGEDEDEGGGGEEVVRNWHGHGHRGCL